MCSPKRISDSRTTHVEILMPADLNGYNRLFGGRLMQWIDVVAGVVARRHSGCEVTTASVDQLEFQAPAFVNDTIAMEGRITMWGAPAWEVPGGYFRGVPGRGAAAGQPRLPGHGGPGPENPQAHPRALPAAGNRGGLCGVGGRQSSGPRPARHADHRRGKEAWEIPHAWKRSG